MRASEFWGLLVSHSSADKHLVLIGGGHAHVGLLKSFRENGLPLGFQVTLIGDQAQTPYSGMLPAALSGYYQIQDLMFDLPHLCDRAKIKFIEGRVTSVDAGRGQLQYQKVRRSQSRAPSSIDASSKGSSSDAGSEGSLRFDLASLDVGGKPQGLDSDLSLPVMAVKPISELLPKWQALLEMLKKWDRPEHPRIAIIGGGVSGVEVAMALASRTREFRARPQISLWQKAQLLEGHSVWVRSLVLQQLHRWQVKLRLGVDVLRIREQGIEFCSVDNSREVSGGRGRGGLGRELMDSVILATPVAAADFIRSSGLPVDDKGFVKVDKHLQVIDKPNLFAAGDCLSFPIPLPKAGVYPVRQFPVLDFNLRAMAKVLSSHFETRLDRGLPRGPEASGELERSRVGQGGADVFFRAYKPQGRALALITAGQGYAVGSYGPLGFGGPWVWRWKDRIDRRFMRQMRG